MRDRFAARLLERARSDERIMFLTADLGFGVFEQFQSELPERYLNVGVAEQNMVAVATGLALEGFRCFIYSIGNFPTLRCLEQIRNDAAYHDADVKVVSVGGGFSYGPLGMSHHATEDIAVMTSMPNVTAFTPGTLEDASSSVDAMLETNGTCYLRLDKSVGAEQPQSEPFTINRWRVMRKGEDVAIVAVGGVLAEAQKAAELLYSRGVDVAVISATQVSPISTAEVLRTIGHADLVITVEEHVIRGGLGGIVAEAVAEAGTGKRLIRKGLPGEFVATVGSQNFLRREVGLDAQALVKTTLTAIGQ